MKSKTSREEVLSNRKKMVSSTIGSILIGISGYLIYKTALSVVIGLVIGFVTVFYTLKFMKSLSEAARVKKIETSFPDFLSLVASNLRAGMTVDRAMLLSSRPEFAPLDKEILQAGKDISTGKPVELALSAMSKRIKSEKIDKTFSIILSGIRAGGNLAILLEETSRNMRQKSFVEKKAASQVMMYVIFIFLAVSVFAPGLFSLSGVLVGTITKLTAGMSTSAMPKNIPVSFTTITISSTFIFYFSLCFIIVMDLMASLVLGLVSKGDEKEGLRYFPIMLILSLGIFFSLGKILSMIMGKMT